MTYSEFCKKNEQRKARILWSYKETEFYKTIILYARKNLRALYADRFYFGMNKQSVIAAKEYRIFSVG